LQNVLSCSWLLLQIPFFRFFSCQFLTIEAIHGEPPYSIHFDQSANDRDARDANLVKNLFGKPDPVFARQNDIDLALVIRDKYQGTSGRNAQLGAERVIVIVRAITKVAIRIRELSAEAHRLTRHSLSAKELYIPLLRQSLRFFEIRDQSLHLCEGHIV
jgi:hypothetical protein